MKNQALFSSKDKSKKLKCCLLQFLFGALRVKSFFCYLYATTTKKKKKIIIIEMICNSCIFIIGSP